MKVVRNVVRDLRIDHNMQHSGVTTHYTHYYDDVQIQYIR